MNQTLGRTIQIYLPTCEPQGVRIAELTTRTVQAILIPQNQLKEARKRPELDQVAVYFLFGESEEQAKPLVYIGQTEDVRARLDRHNSEKDFWRTAVVVNSKTQAFTPAHIRWLEWYCCARGKEIGRFRLENTQNPREPFVTEPLRSDCLDAYQNLGVLLTALGYPLFEPLRQPQQREWFTLKGRDAEGAGALIDEGFLVRKGSLCRREIAESALATASSMRKRLMEGGVLVDHSDSQYVFSQDYLFDTPSGAALVILGRSANGWQEWKDSQGRTLHDVKRAPAEAEQGRD
ncbi:MAG: GIY-YIG nuclease family protein [Planctomycetaceae bacterium]|nr:GIY-YIG nuclease family protein [Planctomycetaceae bacterium]